MAPISKILSVLWKHRTSLILAGKLASEVWKTAKQLTREYVRQLVRKKLKRQILIISLEISCFVAAHALVMKVPGLSSRLLASTVLWGMTLYNLYDLIWVTVPELRHVYKTLKGRLGYTVKYFLEISIVNELLEWNILFLAFCFFLAFSSRTYLAASFDYVAPWLEGLALLVQNL